MLKRSFPVLIIGALVLLTSNASFAQGLFGGQAAPVGSSAPSYYYLGSKEGITIAVNLWGFVKNPGRYEVPSSTDLVQLISYGGGPLQNAELQKVKIIRQILQPDSTYQVEVIHFNLEKFQKSGATTPVLLPGDTIIIPGSAISVIQEVLGLLTPLGVILSGLGTILLVLHQF